MIELLDDIMEKMGVAMEEIISHWQMLITGQMHIMSING